MAPVHRQLATERLSVALGPSLEMTPAIPTPVAVSTRARPVTTMATRSHRRELHLLPKRRRRPVERPPLQRRLKSMALLGRLKSLAIQEVEVTSPSTHQSLLEPQRPLLHQPDLPI